MAKKKSELTFGKVIQAFGAGAVGIAAEDQLGNVKMFKDKPAVPALVVGGLFSALGYWGSNEWLPAVYGGIGAAGGSSMGGRISEAIGGITAGAGTGAGEGKKALPSDSVMLSGFSRVTPLNGHLPGNPDHMKLQDLYMMSESDNA